MYPVSQEFLDKMKAPVREIKGKIQIDYTDPDLDQSIDVEANEQARVSYPAQTADNIPEPFAKIASLDGSWVLDGSYSLAPTPEQAETHQMGWWGSQLAGADGAFTSPYPKLTAKFHARPITRLQAIGDSKRGEYPVDFTVKLYNEADDLLHTETVTGNDEVHWQKEIEAVTEVTKMELEIYRWSHAGRQAKILEFFTSIQEVYEDDDIIFMSLLEEREVSRGSLPVGNISSNEIDIRLYNRDRKFDIGNKTSPLYQALKANRRIKAWLGTDEELVPLGTFWSGDWIIPEDEVYAQTTGRDRLEQLRVSEYSTSEVFMADDVLGFDGVDDYVEITNPLIQGSDFTISFWAKLNTIKNQCFFCSRTLLGSGVAIFALTNNSIRVDTGTDLDNKAAQWRTGYDIPINTRTHIAVVKNTSGIFLYINGNLYSSTSTVGDMSNLSNIATLGISHIDGDSFGNQLNGIIDEVRIWNTARTQQQIQENMNKELTGNEEGLVGYWKLNEGQGNIAYDYSGNGNDGTIHGATWTKGQDPNLYELAVNILQDAGLTEDDYWIDPELKETAIPYAYFEPQSHREALRKIAEASLGQVYCDREGIIRIEGQERRLESKSVSVNEQARTSFPEQVLWGHEEPSGKWASLDGSWTLDGTYSLPSMNPEETIMGWWGNQLSDSQGNFTSPYPTMTLSYAARRLVTSVWVVGDIQRGEYPIDFKITILDGQNNQIAEEIITGNTEVRREVEITARPVDSRKVVLTIQKWSHPNRQAKIMQFGDILANIRISKDDYFRKNNPVKWSEIANYIEVETQPLRPDAVEEVYRSNEPESGNKTITAFYNHTPCIDAEATLENVTGDAEITEAKYYSWGADITIEGSGEYELVINARPLRVLNKQRAIAKDDASITDNGMIRYKFPNNPLVQTREVAQRIADQLLEYYKNPSSDIELDWRGNPALLLGDTITISDGSEQTDYRVSSQQLEYDGGLRAKLEGRR